MSLESKLVCVFKFDKQLVADYIWIQLSKWIKIVVKMFLFVNKRCLICFSAIALPFLIGLPINIDCHLVEQVLNMVPSLCIPAEGFPSDQSNIFSHVHTFKAHLSLVIFIYHKPTHFIFKKSCIWDDTFIKCICLWTNCSFIYILLKEQ